ncbi:MAG: M20/M25/M40 family metallo-hydrolase [Leptospiraceae bacterium]|nr:M20/M25/M40 family metallo-hydrolase [Leptospiraceae bacterium]MDW8305643.1 M20/M25/M40 family metallo-hydrolase [Leptospiraceae bacterium]
MLRKITFFTLMLFIVVIAVVLVRTFTLQEIRWSRREPRFAISQEHLHLFEKNLMDSLRIATISPQREEERNHKVFLSFHDFLRQKFPLVHRHLIVRKINKLSLLYLWPGRDREKKPAVFLGHYDVVPAGDGWQYPPFAPQKVGEFIYGRGAIDDKVTVIGLLQAAELLLRQGFMPERRVYFAFGHDEENGGWQGGKLMADLLKKEIGEAEFVLDEGGAITLGLVPGVALPVATIGVAEKGYLSLKLLARGEGGHSSAPPFDSATEKLIKALMRLQDNPFPTRLTSIQKEMFAYLAPYMPFWQKIALANLWLFEPFLLTQFKGSKTGRASTTTTMTATILSAGQKENVVPHEAMAVVNLRLLPPTSREEAKSYVEEITQGLVLVENLSFYSDPSPISPMGPQARGFGEIATTLKSLREDIIVTPYLVLGATDSRHYTSLTPHVYRFSPIYFTADDFQRMHGKDERISLSSLEFALRFYCLLLEQM